MLFRPPIATYIVTQSFAEHLERAARYAPGQYNGGLDMAAPQGTPVDAAQTHTITRVRRDATGYGWHVMADCGGGWTVLYAHLSEIDVAVGQRVRAGERIGAVGSTGNSTGPHLHFEVRKSGVPVDPAPLLIATPTEPAAPPAPVLLEPGAPVTVAAGWNLRDAPNGNDIGTSDRPMPAEVTAITGDWVRVTLAVWVHRDGVQG